MITAERLLHVIRYDPETGVFTWLRRTANRTTIGTDAGSVNKKGYRMIQIDGTLHSAHRLAWLYMTGKWPADQIDHRNRIKHDNRWNNLREANNSFNKQNTVKARSDSRTGLQGVKPQDGRYWARITVDGNRRSLGFYDTPEQAHEAYRAAKSRYHKGCEL